MLGLVTVAQGLGFLGFRVVSRFGLARSSYGWVGFRVFQLLEVFCGQGISQGQLRLCRVQVFEGLELFCTQGFQCFLQFLRFQGFLGLRVFLRLGYCLGLVTVVQGLGFFRAQSGFALTVGLGCLRLGKVQGCLGFRGFFAVMVFLRVCYGCVGFRFFQGLEWFRAWDCLGSFTVGQGIGFFRVQRFFAVRVLLRVSYGCVRLRFSSFQSCFVLRVVQGR